MIPTTARTHQDLGPPSGVALLLNSSWDFGVVPLEEQDAVLALALTYSSVIMLSPQVESLFTR